MLIFILALRFVSRNNFRTQHFYKKRYFKNKASVALNLLVSVIGRLVARSGRKRGNRQTDGRNDKTTTVTLAAHALVCRGGSRNLERGFYKRARKHFS